MTFEIKAIIFDYGNVLCEPQPEKDIQEMAATAGRPFDEFVQLYWSDRELYDRAELDAMTYWNKVAHGPLAEADVARLVALDNQSWTHPRQKMLAYVDLAREKGLRTALLSNLPIGLRDALEKECPWMPDFDVRTYSCNVRKSKPAPEIYNACLEALGVKPPEAVFFDDRPENIKAAVELGIRAIQFESTERAILDLSTRYGIRLTGDSRKPASIH